MARSPIPPWMVILYIGMVCLACTESTHSSNMRVDGDVWIQPGVWRFKLNLGDKFLPFLVLIDRNSQEYYALAINGKDSIPLEILTFTSDSIILEFPVFQSVLKAKIESATTMRGKWFNDNSPISFTAQFDSTYVFTPTRSLTQLSERYYTLFRKDNSSYDAILLLLNDQGKVQGTFLTEIGDYRYLSGNILNDRLYLSTFDGAHAYLFQAELRNDSLINGLFYSGQQSPLSWWAAPDTQFELSNPYSLTKATNSDEPLDFKLPNECGDTVSWNDLNLGNKVVILELMGSWCPNCMDANRALMKLKSQYSSNQLAIIPIAFELDEDFDVSKGRIYKMLDDLNMERHFLFGGLADKKVAHRIFPMLDQVLSFPTLIFLNTDREIEKVYTGFYGPNTGEYYQEQITSMDSIVAAMIAE